MLLQQQREFFASGKTLPADYRLATLKKLRMLILQHEGELVAALREDFGKPAFETLATETRFVVAELNYMIRHLRRWTRRQRVRNSLVNFPGRSYIQPQPYGQVLVLSPWNYPFQLAMVPVMSALAAGNCVVLKISQKVSHTGEVVARILSHFPRELVFMVRGEHHLSDFLLDYVFDYIFFTGSPAVGKKVMAKAAENLTPFTLELGGKNPCVVAADARLDYAARRIASGKFINAGQTCIAPDYLLVDAKVKDRFLALLAGEIRRFYGEDPAACSDYCRMISPERSARMAFFTEKGRILSGGRTDPAQRYAEPTLLTGVEPGDPVMQEEIFGPVLPVFTYDTFDEVFPLINKNPKSLAAYLFTGSKQRVREFLSKTQSGSVAVNDTIMQVVSPWLPFGGIGPSGTGRYHGKKSFETFSNMRSVLEKSNLFDLPVRYPPYTALKTKLLKWLMR